MIRTLNLTLLPAAVAALMISLSPAVAAPLLQPPGLKPGDAYHLAFVSESPLIAINVPGDNDTLRGDVFVQWAADLAGIDQGPNGAIEWRGLVSTPELDARDHLNISAPVYLLDGTKIADGPSELWSTGPSSPISINEYGVRHSANQFDDVEPLAGLEVTMVWNGTRSDGTYNEELAIAGNFRNGSLIGTLPNARPCRLGYPNEFLGNALGGNWLLEPGYPHLVPDVPCSSLHISEVHNSIRKTLTAPDAGAGPGDPDRDIPPRPLPTSIISTEQPASLYGFSVRLVVPVPEPGSSSLLLMAAVGLAARVRNPLCA